MTDDTPTAVFDLDDEPRSSPFETRELLDAVDAIDRLRDFLNDTPGGGPPRLRTDLLRLHQRSMHVVNHQVDRGDKEAFFDDAAEIADQLAEMTELIGRLDTCMSRLIDLGLDLEDDA